MVSPNVSNRFFHEFFPPPRFLEMPAVGLAISDGGLVALELIRRKSAFAVGRFGRRALPHGLLSGGSVTDADAFVSELRALREELRLDFVNASLPEEKAYLFKTSIPQVSKKEMRSAIDFKLEENVPIPARETLFDYSVIDGTSREEGHIDVSVTVLPKAVVEGLSALLASAGLTPLSFELEAQAVARAVVGASDAGAALIVNFGEARTGLFIVARSVVQFTSTVEIGGRHITEAIAKHLSVSEAEAKRIKEERAGLADKKNMDLFFSVMNALAALTDEVNKLATYWNTHKEPSGDAVPPITRIMLCGKDGALPGFDEYLARTIGVPAEVANVWRNVCSFDEYIPPLPLEEALDFAAAIGLALPKSH